MGKELKVDEWMFERVLNWLLLYPYRIKRYETDTIYFCNNILCDFDCRSNKSRGRQIMEMVLIPTPLFYDEFSDPDLIRVEDTFYLVGTTMHCNPGLVVLESKDLKLGLLQLRI